VDVEDLSKHRTDAERIIIGEEAADAINRTKAEGHKVVGVGVTVVRALENNVTPSKKVTPADTWTDKFIFPPYEFSVPDALISGFHLPESTMLMAVAAFGGFDKVKEAYQVALDYRDEEGGAYRFGPYGDAMLIL
jgi:S-adenosylmethionine:tRNA ribosyltransferase-isomerase